MVAAGGVVCGGVEAEGPGQLPPRPLAVMARLAAASGALALPGVARPGGGVAGPAQQSDEVAFVVVEVHQSSLTAALENP